MSSDGSSSRVCSPQESQTDVSTLIFRRLPAIPNLSAQNKRELKSFLQTLETQVTPNRFFTCLITNDSELRRLNRFFLGHDYATDVLSFPLADDNEQLGEIAISIQRAAAQALEHGHDCQDELRLLMLHGVLHLMGMDHETDRGDMARAERKWRAALGLPPGLISRRGTRLKAEMP